MDASGDCLGLSRRSPSRCRRTVGSIAFRAPIRKASRVDSAQPDNSMIIVDDVTLPKQLDEAHDNNHAPIDENTSPEDELSTEKAARSSVW